MQTDNRQFLLHGDTISLNKINMKTGQAAHSDPVEFTVLSKIGEGGSSVCYEACCENDGTNGRLKEFYPVDLPEQNLFFSIERGQFNQLTTFIRSESSFKTFEALREEFKEAYCTLAKAKNRDFGAVLNNYIPPFELYEGVPCEGSSFKSIYVWTRHDKRIKPFDRYIEEKRIDIENGKGLELYLFNVLNAVLTLAKCVRALHTADLLHTDIKPANFGVAMDENGVVDSSNISLFDVNTVYSANDGFTKSAGTVGFRAPELTFGRGTGRSDVYSIGATLFNAIFACDGGDGLYRDEYYSRIDTLVGNSRLLKGSDKNSNSALHDILARIFKLSLAHRPDKRYKACSYLVEDLTKARALLLPYEAQNALTELGQEIRIVNVEQDLDSDNKSDALGAVQRVLYEYPLYDYIQNGEIRALVLGGGTYAQRFIDTAFAVIQAIGCRLSVTVVSDNIEADRDRYLNSRPAFSKFFTVDGIPPEGDSLGEIAFVSTLNAHKFNRDDSVTNLHIMKGIKKFSSGFSYCFIALGNDALNRTVAKDCLSCSGLLTEKCSVHLVQQKYKEDIENAHLVLVGDAISASGEYEQLKRMAFNCHCLWNSSLNVDLKSLKADFMKPYNFKSSMSNALSVKYKLHCVGINCIDDKFEAARRYFEAIKGDESVVDRLATLEHRRWLVDAVCNGWDTLTDYSTLENDTRDRRKGLHPCVVLSREGNVLGSGEWIANDRQKWDTATEEQLLELDALDRTSVLMHRHFVSLAKQKLKVSDYKADIEQIRHALSGFDKALQAFEQFVLCVGGIIDGRKRQVKLYSYYRDRFKCELKKLSDTVASGVAKNFESIEITFYPLLQSLKYTDYKLYDRTLVEGIPFILTYSTDISFVLPIDNLAQGDGYLQNKWFDLAAPMIAANPKTVTFVADACEFSDVCSAVNCFEYIIRTADSRNLQTKINVIFAENDELWFDNREIKLRLKELSPRIGNIEFLDEGGLKRYFSNMQSLPKSVCLLRTCVGSTFERLRLSGIADVLPNFDFNTALGSFETNKKCEFLKYINRGQCLKPSDMPEISTAKVDSDGLLSECGYFLDVFNRFDLLKEIGSAWFELCDALKKHTEQNDRLFEFEVGGQCESDEFFVAAWQKDIIQKLLQDIKKSEPSAVRDFEFIIGNASAVKLKIFGNQGLLSGLKKLALKQRLMGNAQAVRVISDGQTVKAFGSGLVVEDFSCDGLRADCMKILEILAQGGHVIDFEVADGRACFCFSSQREKFLMTNPEAVLGLFVCHEALESCRFDDVIGTFDSEMNKSVQKYPFDVILIKEFRSLIIECSVEPLNEAIYEKLLKTYRNIGINAKPILICWGNVDAKDTELIEKYEKLGVATICARDDIFIDGSIAGVLSEILNG